MREMDRRKRRAGTWSQLESSLSLIPWKDWRKSCTQQLTTVRQGVWLFVYPYQPVIGSRGCGGNFSK